MWSHHGDHRSSIKALRVVPFNVGPRSRPPKPDFYLSAAKAPYPVYHELSDPYLESYYARPSMRKTLLEHGIIHPKDYQVIFGLDKSGKAQSTQETLRKITLLTRAERSEVPPERDLLPYLPDAMRRLVRAGAKMSAASVRNAKNELMSKPLDYVVLRLEEQLRAVKHAAYIAKQPVVQKNVLNFGFKDFVYENVDPNNPEDMKKVALLQREQDAFRHFEDRYHDFYDEKAADNRLDRILDPAKFPKGAPDPAHHDKERAKSTAVSRLRIKLHKHLSIDPNAVKRKKRKRSYRKGYTPPPPKLEVKTNRKQTEAIKYREELERKRLKARERTKYPTYRITGPRVAHRCHHDDAMEHSIHKKAQEAAYARSRGGTRNNSPAGSRAPTPYSTMDTAQPASSMLTQPMVGDALTHSQGRGPAPQEDNSRFGDRDPRLPRAPSGSWPWKELQLAQEESAQQQSFSKSMDPPNLLVRLDKDGRVYYDTASEDIDVGTSEPGASIQKDAPQAGKKDFKELPSSPSSHGLNQPPTEFSHSPAEVTPVSLGELSESAQQSMNDNADINQANLPITAPPATIDDHSERDPLPKAPSGDWPWKAMQKENEDIQTTGQSPGAIEPPNMLLRMDENGVQFMDTLSSIVDVNIPGRIKLTRN